MCCSLSGFLFDFACLFGLGFRSWLLVFCSFVCLLFCFVRLVVAAAWGWEWGGGRWGGVNFWFFFVSEAVALSCWLV